MTLKDAIEASEVQTAEQWHDGYLVQVSEDPDGDGYTAVVRQGYMPPHSRIDNKPLDEAEAWAMQIPLDPDGWTSGESES